MGAKLEGQWKDNPGKRRLSKVCVTSGDQQLGPVLFGTLKMSGAHIESVHMHFPPVCTGAGQALATCRSEGQGGGRSLNITCIILFMKRGVTVPPIS